MMKINVFSRKILLLLCVWGVSYTLISCYKTQEIVPRFLFSLSLGTFPNEYTHWNKTITSKVSSALAIREGVFYIGNGNRVLSVTSSGYLLDYIVNDDTLSSTQSQSYSVRTNNSSKLYDETFPFYQYPLQWVSNISVDSKGRMLIANAQLYLPDVNSNDMQVDNISNQVELLVYSQEIVPFNIHREKENKYFASIMELFTRDNDDIVLVSNELQNKVLYSIEKNGRLLTKLVFPNGVYPKLTDIDNYAHTDESEYFALIKSIVPSLRKNYVYVQFDYYRFYKDEFSESLLDISRFSSRIYKIDMNTAEFIDYLEVPFTEEYDLSLRKVLPNETFLLIAYHGNTQEDVPSDAFSPMVKVLTQQGVEKESTRLLLPDVSFYDVKFAIDEDGNIGGLFLLRDRIEAFWWQR